jgi:hypothetical protein
MMKDFMSIADQFVSAFVDKHVKTRILDGRPDRVFIKTLTLEIGQLLRDQFDAETIENNEQPARKAKKGAA